MSPAAAGVLLQCEHLTVRRGDREVVRDVSLELRRGELVALLGPNGAGKSTLLDALGGALPPARGAVQRRGRVATALQAPDLARRTAIANVKLALAWWGVPRPERTQRALAALRTMGAEHLAGRQAATLSGGERRRVHIARVLAVQPDILMLDEPFSGLDAEARATLLEDAVSALHSETRATLVVVHDRAEAWALADRLLILIDGALVAAGAPRDLLEFPPSIVVARFLGFDGELDDGDHVLLTRPAHVILDSAGPLRARVRRAVPLEDGARLELVLEAGSLYAASPFPAPRIGETVRVRVVGGARFPREAHDGRARRRGPAGGGGRARSGACSGARGCGARGVPLRASDGSGPERAKVTLDPRRPPRVTIAPAEPASRAGSRRSPFGLLWRVAVVEHQRVAVWVRKERHVADARIEDLAAECHAAGLERGPRFGDILDMKGDRVAVDRMLEAHLLGVHDVERQIPGLELRMVAVGPIGGPLQSEHLAVELDRGGQVVGRQADEVDSGDRGRIACPWHWSYSSIRRICSRTAKDASSARGIVTARERASFVRGPVAPRGRGRV